MELTDMSDNSQRILIGALYKHYKNRKTYRVIGCGHHSENMEECVIYQALYDDAVFGKDHIWIRPKNMFLQEVEYEGKKVQRFSVVEP